MSNEFADVLKGIKVIELSTYAAAPGCAKALAEWGAEVIKIESPNGDPFRFFGASMGTPITDEENPFWDLENANKKGITINLKSPQGQEVFHRLLAEADVFITNIRGGALKKQGIDYETLSAKYPKLVWAHTTGQGADGPDSEKAGYDISSYWARSGALGDFVSPGMPPLNSPSALADNSSNYVLAAGICAALVKAKTTGKGSRVTTSLYGLAVWAGSFYVLSTQYGQKYPKDRYVSNPVMSAYCCADGEWVQIVIPAYERYYNALCKVLGLDELVDDERFNTMKHVSQGNNKEILMKKFEEAFKKKDRDTWMKELAAADIAHDAVRHYADVINDPQAWDNHYVLKHTYESGKEVAMPTNVVQFDAKVAPPFERGPRLGEHTDEVLKAHGYSDEEIEALHAAGIVTRWK